MKQRALAAVLCLWAGTATATAPAAVWYGQSLLLRDTQSGARGMLWLDADGRYTVFYATARLAVVDGVDGPFSVQTRHGRFAALAAEPGVKICLRPDPAPPIDGPAVALFHDAGCLVLQVHPIGEIFTQRYQGRNYELVLAQGR